MDEEEGDHEEQRVEQKPNGLPVTIIFAKTIIGAGVAALPVTNISLGWPLAVVCLLLIAATTKWSLDLITRAGERCRSTSYVETTESTLNRGWAILLEVAMILFSLGLMLVYSVVIGDMLVGEQGDGLLCGSLGGLACSRPFVVAIATLIVLFPLISFRSMERLAFAGWTGVGALLVWALATLILVIIAISKGLTQHIDLVPDPAVLGKTGFQKFANSCGVISTLTTAYSCQAAGMYALKDLRPATLEKKGLVTLTATGITTIIYLIISVGSCLLFGAAVKPDVLQNFTVDNLSSLLPSWLCWTTYWAVRLSFLLGVMTLYPLMMFPARDGLTRLIARRKEPMPALAYYLVTYGISAVVFAVSILTPSIKGPIEVIGATAGAVIGFIIPGLLAFKKEKATSEGEPLLAAEESGGVSIEWNFKSAVGWLLLFIGVLQCITGIAAEALG